MAPRAAKKPVVVEERPGFPQDGEVYVPLEGEEQDPPEGDEPDDPPKPKDPMQEMRDQLAAQARQIEALTRQAPAPKPPEPETDDFYDKADEKLFQDPTGFLKGFEERITKKVKGEMTSNYNKDQGEKELWNAFYAENPDLKPDDDLVKATMSGNMGVLGGLPVSEAMKKLAGLTRERIARYAKTPRSDRPRVEGSRPPTEKPKKPEDDKVVTLSDLIRNRRAKRHGVAKGA